MAHEDRRGGDTGNDKGNGRKDAAQRDPTAKWVAVGAGMGIGSAALVAALLYSRKGRGKPEPKRSRREPEES